MTPEAARTLWPEARDLAARLPYELCESYNGADGRLELCRRNGAEVEPIAVILEDASHDERLLLKRGTLLLSAAVAMAREAFGQIRHLQGEIERLRNAGKSKDYAAECAMKCAEPAFLKYLEERHGLTRPLTPDRAATRVKSLLAIKSRKDLNTDPAAADRWKALRKDFEDWRRE